MPGIEAPTIPAHARCAHTVTVGTRACRRAKGTPSGTIPHPRFPAPRVDQLGPLPDYSARVSHLLDHGTLPAPRPRRPALSAPSGAYWQQQRGGYSAYPTMPSATQAGLSAPAPSHRGVSFSLTLPVKPQCLNLGALSRSFALVWCSLRVGLREHGSRPS